MGCGTSFLRFRGGAPVGAPGGASARRPWRAWALAARVPTLTAAVTPVLVGTAAAAAAGGFRLTHAVGALAVALSVQVGTNFYNDALDFLRGADTSERRGPARATQRGLLSPRQVLVGAYSCFGVAGCVGTYFVWIFGWPVLVAGLLGMNGLSLPVSLRSLASGWHLPVALYFNDLFQGVPLPEQYSFGKLMSTMALAGAIAFFAPSVAQMYEIGRGLTIDWQRIIFTRRVALGFGVLLTVAIFSISKVSPFLYFQF